MVEKPDSFFSIVPVLTTEIILVGIVISYIICVFAIEVWRQSKHSSKEFKEFFLHEPPVFYPVIIIMLYSYEFVKNICFFIIKKCVDFINNLPFS